MDFTSQQKAIVNARLDGITKVVARAGTGKTTVLEGLARAQSKNGRSGLYLAFNKGSELDAKARFPLDWVTVKTVNALAHGVVSPRYGRKFRNNSLKLIEVIKLMGLSWNYGFARLVLDTVNYWCTSDLYEFPTTAAAVHGMPAGSPQMLDYAAVVAKQLWARMVDLSDEVPVSHDGMLKIYQLSQPKLAYPYIMLDEAQDTNRVTWDILKRQSSPLVIVGDPYQSIYQFRGAFNAMEGVESAQSFPLTQSFRFGKEPANIANAFLKGFFWETDLLEGLGYDTRIGLLPKNQPHAVISRTNSAIFTQAVDAMRAGKKLAFIGGIRSYNFERIVDTYRLMSGQHADIRDSFLRDFNSFEDLAEYAESANDMEVKRAMEAVFAYGEKVVEIVPALHSVCVAEQERADVTFSTAHKCKGSTLRNVQLADDFPDLVNAKGELLGSDLLDRQEVHLYYVALTRATHGLQLNSTTLAFLGAMEMDVSRFVNLVDEVVHDDKPTSAPVTPAPRRAIPSTWLPANGQLPGQLIPSAPAVPRRSENPAGPRLAEASTPCLPKQKPRPGLVQTDLFS